MWAVGWHDFHYKCYITTHGTTNPGKPADKKRQDAETNVNFQINVPRPEILAKYNQEMGHVDRNNFYRQGKLKLHSTFHFYNYTLKGVELAGAIKNVIALAAGMCEGLDLGMNAMSSLVTRGCSEMSRFLIES